MKVFISACRATNTTEQNQFNLTELARILVTAKLDFDVALGVYPEEGQLLSTEVTYIVDVPPTVFRGMDYINEFAQDWADFAHTCFEQDCVGLLHDGQFYLAWPNGQPLEHKGAFKRYDSQPEGIPATRWGGNWYAATKEETTA